MELQKVEELCGSCFTCRVAMLSRSNRLSRTLGNIPVFPCLAQVERFKDLQKRFPERIIMRVRCFVCETDTDVLCTREFAHGSRGLSFFWVFIKTLAASRLLKQITSSKSFPHVISALSTYSSMWNAHVYTYSIHRVICCYIHACMQAGPSIHPSTSIHPSIHACMHVHI